MKPYTFKQALKLSDNKLRIALAELDGAKWFLSMHDKPVLAMPNRAPIGAIRITREELPKGRVIMYNIHDYAYDPRAMRELVRKRVTIYPATAEFVVNLICVRNGIHPDKFEWPGLGFDAAPIFPLLLAEPRELGIALLLTEQM